MWQSLDRLVLPGAGGIVGAVLGAIAPDVTTPTGAALGAIVVVLVRLDFRVAALEKQSGRRPPKDDAR